MLQVVAGVVWGVAGWFGASRYRTAANKKDEARLAYKALKLNTPEKHRNNVLEYWGIK